MLSKVTCWHAARVCVCLAFLITLHGINGRDRRYLSQMWRPHLVVLGSGPCFGATSFKSLTMPRAQSDWGMGSPRPEITIQPKPRSSRMAMKSLMTLLGLSAGGSGIGVTGQEEPDAARHAERLGD